jgi:bacterioferritin-associated ferredoxin
VSKSEDVTVKPGEGEDDVLACFCERVKASEIRALVRQGIADLNQIKALTRAGMGACGAKSCDALIRQIMREEGVPAGRIVANTKRPVFVEVPIGILAGAGTDDSGARP